MNALYEGVAHSGRFAAATGPNQVYSRTFSIRFKEISKSPVNILRFSVWCYAEHLPVEGQLIASVRNGSIENIIWNGWNLRDYLSKEKKWFEVTGEFSLSVNGANHPDNEFVFYLWNYGKSTILADDFYFEFSEL